MSRLLSRPLIAAWAFSALAATACEEGPAPNSTLPSPARAANPSGRVDQLVPLGREVLPETLASHVDAVARELARSAYRAPASLPDVLTALDYDAYRSIHHRAHAALWKGDSPFQVFPAHPGSSFSKPVLLHVVDHDGTTRLPFDSGDFSYGEAAAGVPVELAAGDGLRVGHSGFRVLYPLNDPQTMDEVAVFQGASYFRLVGAGQVFGLSARGLAVDIATGGAEEFPDFRSFWLVRPRPGDTTLVFHALLDSPSVTGAYRFELAPGVRTSVLVDARVFARRDVAKLGVAPLSSMFLHGSLEARWFDDVRPEVHDSDGLLTWTGRGEWIWRPLSNRRGLHVTSLRDGDPRGFGLVQRQRAFDHYLDLEADYHRRPSVWVDVEEGDWGTGGVELLEIPTDSEFNDNIAAYWVSDTPLGAGEERRYRYRLTTFEERLGVQTLAQVGRTRIGWDALPGEADPPPRSQRRIVVDFVGGPFTDLGAGASVQAAIETSAGRISDLRTQRLPSGGGWRASFRLEPEGDRPADMRLSLTHADQPVTETWSTVWYPAEGR